MPPPSHSPPSAPLSSSTLTTLLHESHLLSLLHHRNHNQHRLTKWYRHLTTLHRHLRHLLHDSELIAAATSTPERDAAIASANQRIAYLRDVVAPRAYDAFGMVVRDKQFVGFGVALIGVLARVWRVLGGPQSIKRKEIEAEVAEVCVAKVMAVERSDDDMEGVVLSREAYEAGMDVDEEDSAAAKEIGMRIEVKSTARKEEASELVPEKKKKKKRRAERDAETALGEDETSSSSTMKKKKKDRKVDDVSASRYREDDSISGDSLKRKKRPAEDASDLGGAEKTKTKKKSKKRKKDDDIDALFSGIF